MKILNKKIESDQGVRALISRIFFRKIPADASSASFGIIHYLFYLFLFLLPLQTRWIWRVRFINGGFWEYGSMSLYATELVLWCVLGMYLYYTYKNFKPSRPRYTPNTRFFIVASIFGFLFIAIMSLLWSKDYELSLYSIFKIVEAIALFFFILNFHLDFKKIAWVLASSGFIQSLVALWQFSEQKVYASKWFGMAMQDPSMVSGESVIQNSYGRFLRAYGSFPHPNILGGFLVITTLLSLFLFLRAKNLFSSSISFIFFIFNILGIFLTFSRSAYIALVVASLIYLANIFSDAKRLSRGVFFSVIYLVVVIIFSILYQEVAHDRFQGTNRLEKKSIEDRKELLKESIIVASRHPLGGVGIGGYTSAVFNEVNSRKESWEYQPVHSIYPLIASELGLIAFTLFLIFLISLCAHLWQTKNLLGLSMTLSLIFIGFLDHYSWTLYSGILLFWIVFALSLRAEKEA